MGTTTTLLANAIYVQFIARDVAGAVDAGELAAPAGDAAVAPVLRSDLAAATAAVLVDPAAHAGKTYDLTGAEAAEIRDGPELG
ncbi:hypothetical protein [Amycolatopsis pithecellobii]|uniref:Uncharacterized protein n=1 Tax=Amycolatopsis pithecellobii TaxID=664692 RepID=A0A6N7YWM5_9PSEU|nr:hypothetical protein [Amycolatopsis pithecellobii]MTD53273.1 hypothetical protein [Amycolatopsis pithecellobii]